MTFQSYLAALFNNLLRIEPGHFGASLKGAPGAGVERAAARLAAKRHANLAIPSTEVWTRQRHRANLRQVQKGQPHTTRQGQFLYLPHGGL